MRKETKTIEIYQYNELPEEIRLKIIEEFQNDEHRHYFFHETVLDNEYYNSYLADHGFNDAKIYYDISYCQGSGASFDADVNIEYFIEQYKKTGRYKDDRHINTFLALIQEYCSIVIIDRWYSNYVHEKTKQVDCSYYLNSQIGRVERLEKKLNIILDDIIKDIELQRLDCCYHIFNILRSEYENYFSREVIEENISANEYEFLKDGTRY